MKNIEREIVLITDDWNKETTYSIKRNNIEGNSQKATEEILSELRKLSCKVTMYTNLQKFMNRVQQHKNSMHLKY